MASGRAARQILFARDAPSRALALIAVDGTLSAHSWNIHTGEIIRSTDGEISHPLITPDGQWLWWFEDLRLWRRPFGSSPRGRLEAPLRLRPRRGTKVLAGGDGTAVVSRVLPGNIATISLLPIGRVRPGAEPVLIAQVPHLRSLTRSRDDALVAIDTGAEIAVYRAHSGQLVATHVLLSNQKPVGFMADSSVLLARTQPQARPHEHSQPGEQAPALYSLELWDPLEGFRRTLSLEALPGAFHAVISHDGQHVLVECQETKGQPIGGAFRLRVDGSPPQFLGPAHGSIVPGTLTSGPHAVYGLWASPGVSGRMIELSPKLPHGHAEYPPVVGGLGY